MKLNKKPTKEEILQLVSKIFSNNPSPKDIKKAKNLAMSKNIKLTKYKKAFCKKCHTFFKASNHEIRIKKPLKIIRCNNCNYISRYKLM